MRALLLGLTFALLVPAAASAQLVLTLRQPTSPTAARWGRGCWCRSCRSACRSAT